MFSAALAASVLLGSFSADGGQPSSADLASYRTERAKTGRDAPSQVKLALWCEAHGMDAERIEHLATAVMTDPANATARGLLGLVADSGKWRKPEDVAAKIQKDIKLSAALADYAERRAKAPKTADGHWKLAIWCEENDLKAEATAHFTACVRLDPSRGAAWKRLGCKKVGGRWVSDAQLAAERHEAEAQDAADRVWLPRLTRWRADIHNRAKRTDTEAQLAKVTDPRAVPSIVRALATRDPIDQAAMVQMLGQIDGGPASRFLAISALYANSPEVRRLAAETLVRRDPRDFVSDVIGQIRDILKYQVQPVDGPGSPGVLLVEGKEFNIRRRYAAPAPPDMARDFIAQRQAGVFTGLDLIRNVRPGDANLEAAIERRDRMVLNDVVEVNRAAAASQEQLERDIAVLDAENGAARNINDRATTLLTAATGQDLGPDRLSWARWWTDHQGYAFVSPARRPKPTIDQDVPLAYVPRLTTQASSSSHSCFAAGTTVATRDGRKPIETLMIGDLVLSQDVVTGGLTFEPIVAVYHNPPASTVAVRLDDDAIVATGIHRFWSAGKGWTMARDLKPGDRVRVVGGISRVKSVEPRSVQPVFNLEVARGRSFFVGNGGVLVHDNSLVETTPEPFDRNRD